MTVIPPELGGRILWADAPERNERIYAHLGCDESPRHWIVPLDGCAPPDGTTMECARCCRVAELVAGQVTFPEVTQVEIPERGAFASGFKGAPVRWEYRTAQRMPAEGPTSPTIYERHTDEAKAREWARETQAEYPHHVVTIERRLVSEWEPLDGR